MSAGPPLVVIIPGIMGSSLHSRRLRYHGVYEEAVVWGEDYQDIHHTLSAEPHRLSWPATATSILRQISYFGVPHNIYGRLLDFLYHPSPDGLALDPDHVLQFPYDWRQSNLESASHLAHALRDRPNARLFLIAHSMGAIVARLLLGDTRNIDITSRVSHFFQIASPVLGSAKAYSALRRHPELSSFLDFIWLSSHNLVPNLRVNLMQAIRACRSLYELLPLTEILRFQSGATCSPFTDRIWVRDLRQHLREGRAVAMQREQPLNLPVTAIYAAGRGTVDGYEVDEDGHIRKRLRPLAAGDGTVTCASAYETTAPESRISITNRSVNHLRICRHNTLFDHLRILVNEFAA